MSKQQLNERQERFCQEYMLDGNATAAYIRAGYTDRQSSAEANASRMLAYDKVQERIEELQALKLARNKKYEQRLIDFLFSVLDVTILDFYDSDSESKLKPKKLEDVAPERLRAIASFDPSSNGMTSIKFQNKIAAVAQLREILGLNLELSKLILALNNYGFSAWVEDGELKIQKDEV